MKIKKSLKSLATIGVIMVFLILFPFYALGQAFPEKAIKLYVGFGAGGTTDLTGRELASGLEKVLGVPVVVENKTGGGATVCTTLVSNMRPDGYHLGLVPSGVLNTRPHILKLAYDPLKDFTLIAQYAIYPGAVIVSNDSPLKTIDEFVAYVRANPGLTYASSGMYSQEHLAMEVFLECKGLDCKHVPTSGGANLYTQVIGGHVDFGAGGGGHLRFVKQGQLRMLALFFVDKRDPKYPEVPTQNEIGCQNISPGGILVIGPKGIPDSISKILGEAIKKVTETTNFQKRLDNLMIPLVYKDRSQLEKEIPEQFWFYKGFMKKIEEREK